MLNNDLQEAKNAKKDEFYTQLSDIELEMGIISIISQEKPSTVTAIRPQKACFTNTL